MMFLLLATILSVFCFFSLEAKTFFIEHARTEEQLQWGLMLRRFLPEDRGMLFHHAQPRKIHFWSFNCYIDLSVAFIDEKRVIREIKTLKAFPEKMDPARPVFSPRDFCFYPPKDPVVSFFQKATVSASVPVQYVLEMNLGWFERNQVRVGDVLFWEEKTGTGFFCASEELGGYVCKKVMEP